MAYSAKKYWTIGGSALALGFAGMAMLVWFHRNHIDPVSIGMFRIALGMIVVGLALWAYTYRDEVQRQTAQKRWFQGSLIGIAAMGPVVVSLQTHKAWLDAAVQFFFHHAPVGPLYFSLGVAVPVVFQITSVLVLILLDKLSRGPQS